MVEIDLDLDGDGTYEVNSAGGNAVKRTASFASPGVRTLRARVTDDTGAAAVATAQVDVTAGNQPPQLTIGARADGLPNDEPMREGHPVEISGWARDLDGSVVRYEFDLDGDGTYETRPRDVVLGRHDVRWRSSTKSASAPRTTTA